MNFFRSKLEAEFSSDDDWCVTFLVIMFYLLTFLHHFNAICTETFRYFTIFFCGLPNTTTTNLCLTMIEWMNGTFQRKSYIIHQFLMWNNIIRCMEKSVPSFPSSDVVNARLSTAILIVILYRQMMACETYSLFPLKAIFFFHTLRWVVACDFLCRLHAGLDFTLFEFSLEWAWGIYN